MSNVIPFTFKHEQKVRTVMIDGRPHFVAKDVAAVLGFRDPINAIKQHCKGVAIHHPLETGGGTQKTRVISESDCYRLIIRSNLPSAVSAVVVVTPRSHGGNPFKSKEALPC